MLEVARLPFFWKKHTERDSFVFVFSNIYYAGPGQITPIHRYNSRLLYFHVSYPKKKKHELIRIYSPTISSLFKVVETKINTAEKPKV